MAKQRKPKTSKTNRKRSTPAVAAKRGRPRNVELPGMEDRAIKPLEDVAAAYADVRDRRIALNQEEAELKVHAKKLMHKFDKTIYRRNGIEIRLIDGEEDIKVRVKKAGDETEPPDVVDEGEGAESGGVDA